MAKKNIKVRDLKPKKDAKGGGKNIPNYAAGGPVSAAGSSSAAGRPGAALGGSSAAGVQASD